MDKSEFLSALLAWYGKNKRDLPWRRSRDPYAILVSEVMLQQTRVDTVLPYYEDFLRSFPSLESLAEADLDQVLKRWEGLGYYSRARHLHGAAKEVRAKYGGKLPADYDRLRVLPGIGDYTASAVASIAFRQSVPVVDGNVWRVFSRILADPGPPAAGRKRVHSHLSGLISSADPSEFNQAIMELGALVCLPRNPLCASCPVRKFCSAFRMKKVEEFPLKIAKKSLPQKAWAAVAIERRGLILLRRRPANGLWGGLWELPNAESGAGENLIALASKISRELGFVSADFRELQPVKHTFSHFKLTIHPFLIGASGLSEPENCSWENPDSPRKPLPVPFLKILAQVPVRPR